MTRKFLFRTSLAAAIAAIPLAARAAEDVPTAPPPAPAVCPADDSLAFAGPGLRAFLDAETGQLREPTPEETRAFASAVRAEITRRIESLEAVVHPDGMLSMDLQGLFDQHLVAVRAPGGSLAMRCLEAGETPTAPARPLEER